MDENRPHYTYFSNTECEFFPCHKTKNPETFNCLFCYCPLYALGDQCGGAFVYTENGIKDCSKCMIPHSPGGYDHVQKNFVKIVDTMGKFRQMKEAEKGE